MSSIDLATLFKIGIICWTGKTITNTFPRSIDISFKFIANKRHNKVGFLHSLAQVDRLLCSTHINKKQQIFKNFILKCVTRPDLIGVPFILLSRNSKSMLKLCYEGKCKYKGNTLLTAAIWGEGVLEAPEWLFCPCFREDSSSEWTQTCAG